MVERLVVGLFVLGLSFFSYLYGVASTRFELFPYEFIQQAWIGGKALFGLWTEQADRNPLGAISLEPGPPTIGLAAGAAGPDRDLILVTGGIYMLRSHCPDLGCLAWIMDRQGRIYHAWPFDRTVPWAEMGQAHGFSESDVYPSSLHVYDNGDLLVSYHVSDAFPYSVGLAKFDKDGKLLWKNETFSHHKFYVDEHGMIYTPSHRIVDSPVPIRGTPQQLKCEEKKIYEDMIRIVAPDGTVTREISVLQALFDSGYGGLVALTGAPCDPLHLNDVRLLTENDAGAYPTLAAGDLLISLRNLSTLAILDAATARVKWIASGQTVRQHAPRYLGANDILVFDNQGGQKDKGGSRLVKIDLATKATTTLFPIAETPPDLNFYTEIAGYYDLNAERTRALVSLTMQGRGLEIDLRTGKVLWKYDQLHDVAEYLDSTAQDESRRYARFGLSAMYYVGYPSFLDDARRPMAAR